MRGSPLIPVFVLAVVLALAGIPVWALTRRAAPVAAANPEAGAKDEVVRVMTLMVTSTEEANLELRSNGHVFWQGPVAGGGDSVMKNIQGFGLAAGSEVVAKATWKDEGAPHALRLKFAQDGETLGDATLWGGKETEDVITLKTP